MTGKFCFYSILNFDYLQFLYRINFAMEDSLRDLMYRMVGDYTKMMKLFCPGSVEVISNDNVVVKGGKFPVFTVDLKFVNATSGNAALHGAPGTILLLN